MSTIQFYEDNAEDFFERTVQIDMSASRERFTALLPVGGRVLDAGCGSGRDALAFHQAGFVVTAIEAAPALAVRAREHTGLPVQVMTFQELTWHEAFEGIWACASLLHVPRDELADAVTRLRDALTPGGVIYMSFKHGVESREPNGRLFTDLDEAGAEALLATVGGLELLQMTVEDSRKSHAVGERWLAMTCRKST